MTFLIELRPDEKVGQYLLAAMTSIDAITLRGKTNSGKTGAIAAELSVYCVCLIRGNRTGDRYNTFTGATWRPTRRNAEHECRKQNVSQLTSNKGGISACEFCASSHVSSV